MKSLVYSIEDDKDIGAIINKTLEKAGYEVKTFVDGESFFKTFAIRKPEIILLDLMLPKMSGTDILKKIREDENNEEIRIIVISAKHLVMDKVECLDLGADDYIEKPFDLLELIARVDSKKRRIKKSDKIEIGKIVLNRSEHKVFIDQRLIDLTQKEYELLNLLMESYPDCVSREDIFKKIWNYDEILESRTLDVHVKSLRSKLGSESSSIETVYGVGYRFKKWERK